MADTLQGRENWGCNLLHNPAEPSVEERTVEMLKAVKKPVKIPVAVKLSPFYTSMANFAH